MLGVPPLLRNRITTGNALTAFHDGGCAYPPMLAAIASARRYIHCETYILDPDAVGGRFVRALSERARAGVRVRFVVDAVGSYRLPRSWIEHLERAGVYVHVFNPIRFAPMEMLTKRNHRKLLVVDGELAFTGGMNLSVDHVDPPLGKAWRDCMFLVRGPAVVDMDQAFIRSYLGHIAVGEPLGRDLSLARRPLADEKLPGRVLVQTNGWLTRRYSIRNAYVRAIDRSERDILLAHSYFVPDLKLRRALRRARKRGVRVRLLLPGMSDVPIVKRAMESLYDRWLRLGIEIREWPGSMMHLKVGTFDGEVLSCGSYNLDDRSLRKNMEVALWVSRSPVVQDMLTRLDSDWQKCHEVTTQQWQKRTVIRRFREWIAFRLRKRL
jgi:cardiolipin synthase